MKKLLSIFMCLAMVLSMVPVTGAETAAEKVAITIADYGTTDPYVWFNGNDYTDTAAMYIQPVQEGADDVGALHVYQTDGVVAAEDIRLHIYVGSIPAGTYTLEYNIKGTDLGITTLNDACRFYLDKDPYITTQFRNLAGAKTVSSWTKLSETVTTTLESSYVILGLSKYVCGADFYVDNVKLLDVNGNDLLMGAGNFNTDATEAPEPSIPGGTEPEGGQTGNWKPISILAANSGTNYQWYSDNAYVNNATKTLQIVSEGADDVGSIHVYQPDGQTADADMRIAMRMEPAPAGTYTLQYKIKGTDLGNTDNNSNRFYLYGHEDQTNQVRVAAGAKSVSDWTLVSETVTLTSDVYYIFFMVSKYVNGADYYVDNVKLFDANGKDYLCGAGNFCEEGTIEEPSAVPDQLYDAYPDAHYLWYNGNGYTATGDMYIQIVEEGADDVGAVHIYQTDGVVAAMDMRVYLRTDGIPAGTYTLQYNIKGSDLGITTLNDVCRFYLNGDSGATTQFRNLAGTKTLSDWTALSETVTTTADSDYVILGISKYVSGINCYVDNVKLLDGSGNDLLKGAGNFCVDASGQPDPTPTEPEPTEPTEPTEPPEVGATIPVQIEAADPQELYVWFNHNGYTATDDMYIEIVADGADDVGAMHVYQTDGVTGTDDMRLKMHTGYIPAGTYTLKMKLKGTDLGNTNTNDACRFYVSSNDAVFPQIRNLAGAKSVAEWTQFSQTVDTDVGAFVFSFSVSKYVNGADFYVDNLQLLDINGNDMLCGSGNFCTVWEGEPEPVPGLLSLNTDQANAYAAPDGVWSPMYPSGEPDSGTWAAWDDVHYGEIVADGYRDRGALHLKSASYKNTGVAIGVNMVPGQTYTLGLWAKGITNSGRVLAQYGNGNPVIIAASTSMASDWTYYECVFKAGMTQLNIVASDWGNTSIYIDHITLIGADGVDLLAGYGDFCEDSYRVIDPHYLVSFNGENAAVSDIGQVSVAGASDPTLTLNTQEAETQSGLQATWSYDGVNPAYLHRYAGTADTWAGTFAKNAANYRYLRMWVSNPSHVSVDVTVLLSGADTVNYFDASTAKLIRRDGTEVYGSTNNNSGYGENSGISLPKQFAGWLAIPLNADNLLPAAGYSDVITDYANVTGMELEFRKMATTGEGDSSEYYYILDDICLSFDITGKKQSTDDGNEYADYDTSVKGSGQVQNVIFLIGDGMGFGSLDVARQDRPTLYMDTIAEKGGVVGQVATTNLYGAITDSAAAGTALATGFLTKNTVLGLTENLEPVMNLGEYMKQLDKKLGLVTTTYVLDATPAAFAAHTAARGNYAAVAMDILKLGVEVVQGGGRNYLSTQMMDETGKALTLTELAQQQYGYSYATTTEQMNAVTEGKLWGIYEEYNMPWVKYETETDSTPTLAEMTTKTFQLLENENGFFAMIEGGQIDVAGHNNSPIDTRLETLAFDDAVKVAMDYADSHPGTLVIITADHETGGVSVAEDGTVSYYTTSHSAEQVPYYAYGTGAEYFENLTVNTEINYAIRRATMGDTSVGASSVATESQLTATDVMDTAVENGIITYTGIQQPAELNMTDREAAYAVVKYKTDEVNLVGSLDDAKIYYAGDGKWHVSDILSLTAGESHSFQPMSYIKGENYNSIDIAGKILQIDWVGFFSSYESACAFQAHAALTGATPSGLNGLSMTLKDNLDLNFYVAADETALETTQISLTVGADTQTLSLSDGVYDAATGNYKFSAPLAAAQMTESVTFTLTVGQAVLETGSYTVRDYADSILSGSYSDETKNLVKEMLNYGGYAQLYFDCNTDDLAHTDIRDAGLQAVPEQAEMSMEDSSGVLDLYGASLVFRSRIAVRLYVTGDVTGCSFTVNGVPAEVTKKDGKHYVELADILPQDLDEAITIVATDAAGDTLTVTYSPMDYMVRMNRRGSKTLQDLVKAMYNYHLAAEEYLAA